MGVQKRYSGSRLGGFHHTLNPVSSFTFIDYWGSRLYWKLEVPLCGVACTRSNRFWISYEFCEAFSLKDASEEGQTLSPRDPRSGPEKVLFLDICTGCMWKWGFLAALEAVPIVAVTEEFHLLQTQFKVFHFK